uniref:Uncharacterized protein n=1 Tax=Triticum urartu TaxID=4572 RepID=A0A8R7UPK7_TRIUA
PRPHRRRLPGCRCRCRGAVTRPPRHGQGHPLDIAVALREERREPEALRHGATPRAGAGASRGHGHGRGRPPVDVPTAAGRPHDIALVQLEARAVVARLRLLEQAKKPERARARRPRHLHGPTPRGQE